MVRIPPGPLWMCALVLLWALLGGCDNTTAQDHAANAREHLAKGEVRTAVIELKNALQKDPGYAEAHRLLGDADERLGDYPGAQKEYERAVNLGLDAAAVRLGLLRAKVRRGSYQEVIDALAGDGALEAPFAVVLAEAYLDSGDYQHAKVLYQQGTSLSDGHLGLGLIAWQQGDLEQAQRHLDEAVRLDGANWRALLEQGELVLTRGQPDQALAAFTRASEFSAAGAMAGAGLARANLQKGDVEAAAANVQALLRAAPDLAISHYLDAMVRFEQQDLDGAAAALQRVRRLAPDNYPSLYLGAVIAYRQGHYGQAEQDLERYLKRVPDNASAAKLLAAARFDQQDYQGAVDALGPLLDGSSDPQLHAMYGSAQMRLGHPAEAARSLERAVRLAPDMAPFHNQLALSLMAAGDRSGAETELENAIDVDGRQFQSDYLLAMLRIRNADWSGASEAVEKLVTKSPDSPIGYNLRGAVALGTGDRDRARAAFEKSLAIDGSFLPAVRNLANLDEADGDRDAAANRYRTFLVDHPGTEGALVALAELAMRGGDSAAASDYLKRSLEANPGSVRSAVGLARLARERGRLEDADHMVTQALEASPDAVDLLLLRADIDLDRGDAAAARQVAGKLQSQAAATDDPALLLALGKVQARAGSSTLARRNLERALELTHDGDPAALGLLARLDASDGRFDKARARLDRLEHIAADDPATRLLEADLAAAQDRDAEARGIYRELADAGVRDGVMRLAALSLAQGDVAGGTKRLDAWVESHPRDIGAQLLAAEALMRQDQDQAIARYEALVDTGIPVVLNNLAWLYLQKQDPRAVDIARRAVETAPDNADVLDTLGWVLLQQKGDARQAVDALRRSTQLNPGNPSVEYHLGLALRDSGDPEGARAALSRALEAQAFPEADEARAALAAL